MDKKKAMQIMVEWFKKPDYDKNDFLNRCNKETGTNPTVFVNYIFEAFKTIHTELNSDLRLLQMFGTTTPTKETLTIPSLNNDVTDTEKYGVWHSQLKDHEAYLVQFIKGIKTPGTNYKKNGKEILPIKNVDPLTLLTPMGKKVLGEYEAILKDKIPGWEKEIHGALVECAAFCDYLYSNNIINKKRKDRVVVCSQFAWKKYNIDIRTQLNKTSKVRMPKIKEIADLLK
jgi:hypothetical protein